MIYSLIIVLVISSSASALNFLCQDSNQCSMGLKRCEIPSGEQWCCQEKAIICNENNQCSFLTTYLPFIQLRPDMFESESSLIPVEDKIFYSKPSVRKLKYNTNYLLSYHCERLESKKTTKALKLKPNLDEPQWKTNATDIFCPGREQRCPPENTCCLIAGGKYGCCRFSDAVCCSDLIHCCPFDTVCNTETMACTPKHMPR